MGAFMLGNITNMTHKTMKIIGMARFTLIGRGSSGLKIEDSLQVTQIEKKSAKLTLTFSATTMQQC